MSGHVGQRCGRIEDAALLRGDGRFVDDLHLPGMVEAAFLRSPIAHGQVRSIDASAARALPGVHAVLSLADLRPYLTADRLPLQFRSTELPEDISPFVLAREEVCFVGEPILMVIAESRYIAEDALALIDIDIHDLPAVSDCRQGMAPDAPPAHLDKPSNVLATFTQGYGDAAQAIAAAPHTLGVSIKQHRGGAHPIECRGVVARYERFDDTLTLWTSTQLAHEVRAVAVKMLGLDENQVRVITPDVGGGFGAKYVVYPEEIALAAASRMLGVPIKWIEDRREHFVASIQERDQYWDLEVGFDDDGKLLGVRGHMVHDAGAYTLQGINLPYNASTAFPGAYVLPAYELEVSVVETNMVPTIPVRGAGYPEGAFAMERVLGAVADALGRDRVDIHRVNLVPASAMPYETPMRARSGSRIVYDSGDFPACFEQALAAIDHAGFPKRREEARLQGRRLGIGVATGLKGTGRGPFESAIVRIGRSGQVSVYTGAAAMGQGLKTALAQICAEQLGVAPRDVVVIAGDTSTIPLGLGGFASRQTVTAGNAVHVAALQVREKILKIGAELLEAAETDLLLGDGRVFLRGAQDHGIDFRAIADAVSGSPGYAIPGNIKPGLEATDYFEAKALTYGFGAQAVEAEVDVETGEVKLTRYVVVNDCGRAVNPTMIEGQIHGGVVHGIGNALFERMGYDANAQPTTMTLAEYLLPTATEIPPIHVDIAEYPSPLNPLGVKGVGEAGTVPAAGAIISAIENALSDYGVRVSDIPVAPAELFELIQRSSRGRTDDQGTLE